MTFTVIESRVVQLSVLVTATVYVVVINGLIPITGPGIPPGVPGIPPEFPEFPGIPVYSEMIINDRES